MKKQKPETMYESWDVNDKIYSIGFRKYAKNRINRLVRRIFKHKIEKESENI